MKLGTAHQGGRDRAPLGDVECPDIPGYQVLERLGGDERRGIVVWKAKRPGGFLAAIRVIRLQAQAGLAPEILRGLEILQLGRHPNLLAAFGSWQLDGNLVVATELPDGSLWDRYLEFRARGAVGIARDELLEYLAEAARAIDYLNGNAPGLPNLTATGLEMTHGEVGPRTIVFVGGGIKLADSDILGVPDVTRSGDEQGPGHALVDAAPERLRDENARQSDQYSLALTYCQLRTGRLPFPAAARRDRPDLSALTAAERPALARALADDPDDRWPSCRAFLNALQADGLGAADVAPPARRHHSIGRSTALTVVTATGAATLVGTLWLAPAATTTPRPTGLGLGLVESRSPTPSSAAPVEALGGPPLSPSFHRHDQDDTLPAQPAPPPPPLDEEAVPPQPALATVAATPAATATEPAVADEPATARPRSEPTPPPEPVVAVPPRASTPPPLIRLEAPDLLTIEAGRSATLPVKLLCEGIVGPVEIRLRGLPDGLSSSPRAFDTPGASEGAQLVEVQAASDSREGETRARLVATSGPNRAEVSVRVKVQPSPSIVARRRADALLRREDFAAAIPAYNAVLAMSPNDALALHGRGLAYYGLGDLDPALNDIEAAIRHQPANPTALNNRGLIKLAKGDPTAAIADFDAAIGIDPSYAVVRYNRGRAYSEAGTIDKALPDFDEALRLDARFAKAYKARADLYAHKGDRPRALTDYNEAIRLRPDDPAAFNNRGLLLFARGDHRRAIADFDEAIRLNPRYAVVRYNRGRVFAYLGDMAEALDSFNQAMRLDPTLTRAEQARNELLSQTRASNTNSTTATTTTRPDPITRREAAKPITPARPAR